MGDTLWTHTYQKYPTQFAQINSVTPLSGGRILAGAESGYVVYTYWKTIFEGAYYHSSPWFMILDSVGNIIKDTLYGNRMGSMYNEGDLYPAYSASSTGGNVYMAGAYMNMDTDMNGGYFFTGEIDSSIVDSEGVDDPRNFNDFLANVDADFNIVWITKFNWSGHYGHRYISSVRQLPDSSYIVIGGTEDADTLADGYGWAAKVSKGGVTLWNHNYRSDPKDTTSTVTSSAGLSYFRDGAVRADGSIVFVGAGFDDTLPSWHQRQDVWLVSTDSNGCQAPGGCGPDTAVSMTDFVPGVMPPQSLEDVLSLYPNPATTNLYLTAAEKIEHIVIINPIGQTVYTGFYKARSVAINIADLAPGIYFIKINGTALKKFIKE